MRPVLLIVDDDDAVRYTLRAILELDGYDIHEAADGERAWAWLQDNHADLVVTDLKMPRVDGMTLLERLRAMPDPPRAVMITAHGSERHAVDAIKHGALDYFAKPFDLDEVRGVVARALAHLGAQRESEALRAELALSRHLIFRSEAMRTIAVLVQRVGPRDVTVLLSGPSGTGKERVAEALVAASGRAARPFVRCNCAALPRELAEAELFGHARGAFTSAVRARDGLFREADGGTILLDEVAELDLQVQGKLLRVLQEHRVRPVGEDKDVAVDVRVIAATHRDLPAEVRAGRFREDLWYRLGVVQLALPPLSARRDDIPPLVDHFLRKYASRFGLADARLTPRARAALEAEQWPGNVRELEHRIESLVALAGDPLAIDLGDGSGGDDNARAGEPLGLKERVDAFERGLIVEMLARTGNNRSEAARRLGIARITLLDKLKKHGLAAET